jgi:hypothetical protein
VKTSVECPRVLTRAWGRCCGLPGGERAQVCDGAHAPRPPRLFFGLDSAGGAADSPGAATAGVAGQGGQWDAEAVGALNAALRRRLAALPAAGEDGAWAGTQCRFALSAAAAGVVLAAIWGLADPVEPLSLAEAELMLATGLPHFSERVWTRAALTLKEGRHDGLQIDVLCKEKSHNPPQ